MTDWSEVLDQYEAALDEHARLLDGEDPSEASQSWSSPHVPPGGVPHEHRQRADALLARTHELAQQLERVRETLPPLAPSRRTASQAYTSASSSGYVDRSI